MTHSPLEIGLGIIAVAALASGFLVALGCARGGPLCFRGLLGPAALLAILATGALGDPGLFRVATLASTEPAVTAVARLGAVAATGFLTWLAVAYALLAAGALLGAALRPPEAAVARAMASRRHAPAPSRSALRGR